MYIYCITNLINGKKYVGKCHRKPEKTKSYYGSGNLIKLAIKKYGKENFKKEIIEQNLNVDNIYETEQYWIKEMNCKSPIGYNLCDGGKGMMNPSDETRKKMSESRKGKYCGKRHWNYGGQMTEETIKKISDAVKIGLIGHIVSDETKNKISDANKKYVGELCPSFGRKHTIESRKKMSESQKGRKNSLERIEKQRLKMIGRKASQETKMKMSESQKNRPSVSDETKIKMSQSTFKVSVHQIDKITNEIINTFESISEAAMKTGCNIKHISSCINGNRKSNGGYKWRKVGEESVVFDIDNNTNTKCKPVYQMNKKTNEIITIFNSIKIASEVTNTSANNITLCLTKKRRSAGGYKWEYVIKQKTNKVCVG